MQTASKPAAPEAVADEAAAWVEAAAEEAVKAAAKAPRKAKPATVSYIKQKIFGRNFIWLNRSVCGPIFQPQAKNCQLLLLVFLFEIDAEHYTHYCRADPE